jgi:hypothetical protein
VSPPPLCLYFFFSIISLGRKIYLSWLIFIDHSWVDPLGLDPRPKRKIAHPSTPSVIGVWFRLAPVWDSLSPRLLSFHPPLTSVREVCIVTATPTHRQSPITNNSTHSHLSNLFQFQSLTRHPPNHIRQSLSDSSFYLWTVG